MNGIVHHYLDITDDVCPMTFVKTRLLIEKMKPGEIAEIRLTGREPLENVPDSVTELGHLVLRIEREPAADSDADAGAPAGDQADAAEEPGIHRIRIQKS